MAPLVSVLILNYRTPQATVRCVRRFLSQTIADQLEILIIDNHSLDDSVGIFRNHFAHNLRVRIIETPYNGGFGYGYNRGAQYASGEILLLNNPEKLMPEQGVEKLVHTLHSDHDIGILAPKLTHEDGTRRLSIRAFPRLIDVFSRRSFLGAMYPKHLSNYLLLDRDSAKKQEVDWVVGGCFMIKRPLFQQLEGFDERFFLFFEDTDLCRRCTLLGKKVLYDPSVIVCDAKRRLSGESFWDLLFKKTGRIHLLSAWKYFRKWGLAG